MAKKYFVTVIAASKRALLNLQKFDLDLFQPTSRINDRKEFVIQGLMVLEDVAKLVDGGYQVLVQEDSAKRARARQETVEFEQWIKQMKE